MAEYGGWTGKVLRVDLTTGKISSEDTIAKYKDVLGGQGLAWKVLWDEVPPGTKAWDPENRIIFGVGPATGTGWPTSGRLSITSLFPMNPYELPATGHAGGHWASELKFAGWDSVIVQGKANSPVWIYINDDKVEIRDAKWLWGNGIFQTTAEICAQVGAETKVAAIGQAGENLVKQSTIMVERSHGAGGLGSVMGSKNLKAIAVKGSGSLKIAGDKNTWKSTVTEWLNLCGANSGSVVPSTPQPWSEYSGGGRWWARPGLFWGAANPPIETGICAPGDLNKIGLRTHKGSSDFRTKDASGKTIGELFTVRMGGCHSCPLRCHVLYDNPMLEKYGYGRYQSNTCSGNQGNQHFVHTNADPWQNVTANNLGSVLADDYGIWNNYSQLGKDFTYCYKKGIIKEKLSEEEYNSIPWDLYDVGDPSFNLYYYKAIAYKEGELGEVLGLGSWGLRERWGIDVNEPDYQAGMKDWKFGTPQHHVGGQEATLINLVLNRDAQNHVHNSYWGNGLPYELSVEILDEITGLPGSMRKPNDLKPVTQGQARFAMLSIIHNQLHDSLTMCDYNGMSGAWVSPYKDRNYRGEPDIEARLYSILTGDTVSRQGYEDIGKRIVTLFRALTARYMNEKDQRNKHDLIPNWVFDLPADKEPFTPGHTKQDRADIEKAKDLFYEEFGWDKTTGLPTRAELERLNLGYVADDMETRGLLP
ncbi:aldehyde ferredoxin oxidoreductase N-terminal domain-containing protein [Chloroflexota bacterium]